MAERAGAGAGSKPDRPAPPDEAGEGNGLPSTQRGLFEKSLKVDLSCVRVHTGDAADKKAKDVNARAYAQGQDIFFANGQYQPGTEEGDRLLAHEVAHTAQQKGGAASSDKATTQPGDSAERNADGAADAMVQGAPAEISTQPESIARRTNDEPIDAPAAAPDVKAPDAAPGDGKQPAGNKAGEEEQIGELSAQRIGQEEDEGEDGGPMGPPQNSEAGKAEIAGAGAALPKEGGAAEVAAGGVKPEAGGGGGGGGEVAITDDLKVSIEGAQADAKAGSAEAEGEAAAYKSEMKERRDRFEGEQNALTLEQLKTMSGADKRSTLVEMGYEAKKVKKMKDAELDGLIAGRIESEQRKTKILGMDPEELRALSAGQKSQFLADLGVDRKDLDKIGQAKAAQAFDDVMRVAHVPGQHKVKVKVKGGLMGKSWELNIKVDAEGNADIEAKKKGGFLSKLWGWVKAALPIILTVLAPLTGGATLIALAVYQTVTAIATGDWLGAVIGAAGAIVGIGAIQGIAKSASAAAKTFGKIASIAGKVKNVAQTAKLAMVAAQAKSPGSLLAALATGAASFAGFASDSATKFQETMQRWADRLDKWAKVISGGEKVVAGVKSGDPGAALGGAFDAASALVSTKNAQGEETSQKAKNLEKYSRLAGYASAGTRAAKGSPPNYSAIVDAALGIAGELSQNKRFQDATKITSQANKLAAAIASNDPAALAAAALGLAEAIQLAKYDDDNPGQKDEAGKPIADDERTKITTRYAKASSIVKFASAAINAAGAKPRPNYIAALDAATNLIADLTENKKLDQAAVLTSKFDAWTAAVRSKDENAIIAAGTAFGEAINGMRDIIKQERDDAKKAAEAKLAPGETLGEDGGDVPRFEASVDVVGQMPFIPLQGPGLITELSPTAVVTTSEEYRLATTGRESTPNSNYTVISGDTLSGIGSRFGVQASQLSFLNPQLINSRIYVGQKIFVPGADVLLTPSVTTTVTGTTVAPGQTPNVETTETLTSIPATRPAYLQRIVDAFDLMAEISGNGPLKELSDLVGQLVKAESKHRNASRSDLDAYKSAVQNLKTLAQGAEFGVTAFEVVGDSLKSFFPNNDVGPGALQQLTRIKNNLGRIAQAARIPLELTNAITDLMTLADSSKSVEERASAAQDLIKASGPLAKDFSWATGVARALAARFGATHVYAATSLLRQAADSLGDVGRSVGNVVASWATPVLKTLDSKTGELVAREWVGKITVWATEVQAGKIATSIANRALSQAIGRGLKSLAFGPVGVALDVAQLEVELMVELNRQVRYGTSHFFSALLFGKTIDELKVEILSKQTGTSEESYALFRYLFGDMLRNAKPYVKTAWPTFATETMKARGVWYWRYCNSADALQRNTGLVDAMSAAGLLKGVAIAFLDAEFKKEFKQDP